MYLPKGHCGTILPNLKKDMTEAEAASLPLVTICLLGDFKSKFGTNHHMIALADETVSGIQTGWWVEELINIAERENWLSGHAFASASGELDLSSNYDAIFWSYLKQVQQKHPSLLSPDVDVDASYGISTTPRKTKQNQACCAGLGADVQDVMNRWRW